eukprot:CAMPEP_0202686598 /NCGR_PEP_ID=MMETSP1385-20130828/2351_1 /ASSEMBLY_ACC=CAM_ASM_000861 /TAXON_ID=933848 /ORGANISM="Elphidium margaritaceum" /LENGTH=253 /DNA_ID=CAMNT_0049341209 /DNA_START=40 /DNA_END=801 /DNA_ORIENTATION=-
MAHFADDSKEKEHPSRIYFLTQEAVEQIQKNSSLLKTLQASKEMKDYAITYNDQQIIVTQGAHKLDRDTVDRVLQETFGAAHCYSQAEFIKLVDELASIEKSRQQLLKDPAGTLTNILQTAEKGANFIKHNPRGAPRQQWFSIKGDRLYWRDKEKGAPHLNRSMEMKAIVRITPGKETATLKSKKLSKLSEDVCFSVIGVRKSLDLQCKSRDMRDEWFTYIEFMHRHYVRAKKKTVYLTDLDNPLDDDLEMCD